ncbi:MAG TPA: ABC transporter permease [Bacteroidales bacterium]|nr:ABC transporter permease [Bacteroidales bacterium]
MNFSLFIARRYLFARKSHHIINIISGVSVAGVTIGTMALIVVLSVFNGFENIVVSLFNSFDPDLKITVNEGKTFNNIDLPAADIRKIPGVVRYTEVVEENALLRYGEKQYIATIKGVDDGFINKNPIDSMIAEGDFVLTRGENNFAVAGYGVAYFLGINLNNVNEFLTVYVPKRGSSFSVNPEEAFNTQMIYPSGIFSIQQDFDSKYVIVPLRFARGLLDYKNEVTSVEIGLAKGADIDKVQSEVKKLSGSKFTVKNRFQQQEVLYKIMKSEKWAVFLILAFILLIATFNVIGSLSMLILDKTEDIAVLRSMGADNKLIRKIFLTEGLFISLGGALLGLILGFIICFIQQKFGIVRLQSADSSFVISAYPVQMKILDFVYVFLTVFAIGIATAWYPVRQISKKHLKVKL